MPEGFTGALREDIGRIRATGYEMNLLRNEHIGKLRLGASTTIAQYVLPPLWHALSRNSHKSLCLYLTEILWKWKKLCRNIA